MSPTSSDWVPELQEALWEVGKDYGVTLEVGEQVAIARSIAKRPMEEVSANDVRAAFAVLGLTPPTAAYAKAVLQSVKGVKPKTSILDLLLQYRKHAIRSLSMQFGGKTKGQEEALRNNLHTFLVPRGYKEAQTGRGRTDIRIPAPEDELIEVKVWTDMSTYLKGLEETSRYIHTERPDAASIVVFGDREPLPVIVESHTQERAADEYLEGLTVPVVVVPFEVDAPSKAAQLERKRRHGK